MHHICHLLNTKIKNLFYASPFFKIKNNHASQFSFIKKESKEKSFFRCIIFLKQKFKILLEEYVITLCNRSSRILGLVLYTLLPQIIFKKGFDNRDIKMGLKHGISLVAISVNPTSEIPNFKIIISHKKRNDNCDILRKCNDQN